MKESDPIPLRPRRRRRLGCLSAQRDEMRPGKRCTAPGREGETSRCMARLRLQAAELRYVCTISRFRSWPAGRNLP